MSETGKFIGPLTEESLKQAGSDFGIYYGSDIAFEIARERTGREAAQLALSEAREKLEKSKIDKMTGFLQRDAFLEEVQKRLDGLQNENHRRKSDYDSGLFIMLDIVGLGDINDEGGHAAGDKAIRDTADFIRHICRLEDGDIAGRLSRGDEFGVFMPFMQNKIEHVQMIDKITARIDRTRSRAYTLNIHAPAIRYRYATASSTHLITAEDLLAKADTKGKGVTANYSRPI